MAAYSFQRFRREICNAGRLSLPFRLVAWFMGMDLRWQAKHQEMMAEASRMVENVASSLSAAELADPRTISESRWREVAAAAKLTEDDLLALRSAYDWFGKTASMRRKQWWQEMAIHAGFLLGVPLLLMLLAAGLVALAWCFLAS